MHFKLFMIETKIQNNIPLAPLTTFKIGGPAKFFIEIGTKEDLIGAVRWAKEKGEKIFILGGGSNILIGDKGVDGFVVKINNNQADIKGERVHAGAGALLSRVNIMANGSGLSGLELSVGIPGTVGGAIRGNAGAYGFNIGDSAETVEVFNFNKNHFEQFSKKDCRFGYRDSIFKYDPNLLIWNVILKLENGEQGEMKDKIDEHIKKRTGSQPRLPSAGCIFKNFSLESLRSANEKLAGLAESSGKVKGGMVGAGWIIELLDLKGKAIGGAKISLEHANFIVNTGKATSEDVIMLISYIKQQVRDRFKVQLHEEIQYFGI